MDIETRSTIMSSQRTDDEVREAVRERYATAARLSLAGQSSGCGPTSSCCDGPSCCSDSDAGHAGDPITADLYDATDAPSDSALSASLGCGNPTALVELHPGEDVLDLGSGGGLDVLLSARRIAPGGTAYGLDLTPQMIELAERNRAESGLENARFLLGSIEDIPLPDVSVDVVISNCVINLSTDKDAVLREAFRVLRPGGRFAVSDIVLLREIPASLRHVMGLWTGCISGSLVDSEYIDKLRGAGFVDASVEVTRHYDRGDLEAMAGLLDTADLPAGLTPAEAVEALDGAFASAFIRASKPA